VEIFLIVFSIFFLLFFFFFFCGNNCSDSLSLLFCACFFYLFFCLGGYRYERIKDMEAERTTMNREIVALQKFKEMMNEMMGKVETVRRASIAIRHKIPVSKLGGDPAIMQEVVNRMTQKVVEMEKELEDVQDARRLVTAKYKSEQQKCNIQTQQVIDARGGQALAVSFFFLFFPSFFFHNFLRACGSSGSNGALKLFLCWYLVPVRSLCVLLFFARSLSLYLPPSLSLSFSLSLSLSLSPSIH